jgi:hypothetical protein
MSLQLLTDPIWVTAIATLVIGVGTLGTLVAALVQINTERQHRHKSEQQAQRERHFAQARLISAVMGPEERSGEVGGRTAVYVINGSQEPVYRLVIGLVFIQGAAPHSIEDFLKLAKDKDGMGYGPITTVAMLPGGTFRAWIGGTRWGTVMMGRLAPEVAFVDREGTSWIRRASGQLEELRREPFEYFEQWGLNGPYELQVPEPI